MNGADNPKKTQISKEILKKYLVGVEVECELGIVLLDDDPGGLLHRLRTHATHLIYCNVCNVSICGSSVVV